LPGISSSFRIDHNSGADVRKLIYWLAAVILVFALVMGLRAWLLSRITYQPEWYHEQQTAGEAWKKPAAIPVAEEPAAEEPPAKKAAEEPAAPGRVRRAGGEETHAEKPAHTAIRLTPLQQAIQQQGEARITAEMFVPTLLNEMAGQDAFDPYTVVRGAKTTIQPGRMVVEMMVNLEKIPRDQLTPEGARVLDQLRGMLPEKTLQQVYIKGDLQPVASGEHIILGGASQIHIGRFTFSLADLQSRFHIDPAISMSHFAFSRFELHEGYLLLRR